MSGGSSMGVSRSILTNFAISNCTARTRPSLGIKSDRLLGAPEGATEITALLSRASTCREIVYLACSGQGGATIHRCLAAIMGHGIQEWHVDRAPYEKMLDLPVEVIEGMVGSGERIFAWGGELDFS